MLLSPLKASDGEAALWRAEQMPGWRTPVLLLFIMIVLVVLLVIPELLTRHNATLRRQLAEVAAPMEGLINDLELAIASEVAAIRGYVITEEEEFLQHFREVHIRAEQSADSLRRAAPQMGEEVAEAARALLAIRNAWMAANLDLVEGRLSPAAFSARLLEQQRTYEEMLEAASRLDAVLAGAVQAHRQKIQQAERLRSLTTAALVILAFLAAGAALWLGLQLRTISRHLLRRAQEEAALRRIAELITAAENLGEALQRIADGVTEMVRADGAHIEQVDFDQQEIEIVSISGAGSPPLGTRAPYPGSLAEKVIESGEPELTSVTMMVQEKRPLAEHMAAACPACELLVVPLISEGAALGALMLNRSSTKAALTTDEVIRVRLLANMAALVLRRLYLFEQVRRSEVALRETTHELRELNETLEERVRERTEQMRLYARELARSNHALQQRNRELQDFAHVASHDLQEPLRKVVTFSDLLMSEAGDRLKEQERHYLERMQHAAERMSTLISDLLAFSRVQAKGEVFRRVDLGEVAREVLTDLEVAIQEAGAAVEVGELCEIEADPTQMRQLLQNLVANALKFRKEEEPPRVRIRADVRLEQVDGWPEPRRTCVLEVEDNGIGFDERYLSRIFGPFQRLHGRGTYAGTGMGLAIVRRIVERHHGEVAARSTPGEGSTFIVKLPVEPVDEQETQA